MKAIDRHKEHAPGSRKGKMHQLYDEQAPGAAWTLGLKLGLKQGTLRSWLSNWHRTGTGAEPTVPVKSVSPQQMNSTAGSA